MSHKPSTEGVDTRFGNQALQHRPTYQPTVPAHHMSISKDLTMSPFVPSPGKPTPLQNRKPGSPVPRNPDGSPRSMYSPSHRFQNSSSTSTSSPTRPSAVSFALSSPSPPPSSSSSSSSAAAAPSATTPSTAHQSLSTLSKSLRITSPSAKTPQLLDPREDLFAHLLTTKTAVEAESIVSSDTDALMAMVPGDLEFRSVVAKAFADPDQAKAISDDWYKSREERYFTELYARREEQAQELKAEMDKMASELAAIKGGKRS